MNTIELGWKETKGLTYHNYSLTMFGFPMMVSFDRHATNQNYWKGTVMDEAGEFHQKNFSDPIDAKNYCLRKAEELSKAC